jgi:predicted ATPase with chaperone activity
MELSFYGILEGFMQVSTIGNNATQPCPCGYYIDPAKECTCVPPQIQKYMARISDPLLDRIDIHFECLQ